MYRLAIAFILAIAFFVAGALLVRAILRRVDAEADRMTDSGGPMPRIAFFLLLCVMVFAISTGAT